MSTIPSVDTALLEVHEAEMHADERDDEAGVCACKVVLDLLLDVRAHLPQQRLTSP